MNILFVCTGNTCRSAMAEWFLKKIAIEHGFTDLSVSSCGTAASSFYRVPDIVLKLMAAQGIDMRAHKSRQVNEKIVNDADVIIVMEESHKEYIRLCFPQAREKIFLLKNYAEQKGLPEIADPIGRSYESYAETVKEIKACVIKLADKLLMVAA